MPTTQKIRYSDCDPQGIVFNGNYARYWDDAMTDWFEESGLAPEELHSHGVDILTARIEMDFKASATLGDEIETSLSVESFGNTSMRLLFETTRLADSAVIASGSEVIVFVDVETFRPQPPPAEVKRILVGESPQSNLG